MVNEFPTYLQRVETMLAAPPFEMEPGGLNTLWATIIERLQQDSAQLTTTVMNGVVGLGSFAITAVLTLVLTFFFIKDAARFTPWLTSWTGPVAGPHLATVASRTPRST